MVRTSIQISILTIAMLLNGLLSYSFSKNSSRNCQEINPPMKGNIKSVKIFKTGDKLADPIIELYSNESVTLFFDDLSEKPNSFSYTITHYSSDWVESGLIKSDYMEGFDTNPINDYQNAVATTVPYTHFTIQIPNNDVKLKLSGNYLIKVFDTYNPETIVIEQRFMVVEPLLSINALVRRPVDQNLRLTSQQLDLTIGTTALTISNPYTDLIPVIFQNNQTFSRLQRIKPVFIRNDEVVYTSPENLILDGVNEYRWFDINSIRFLSSGIQRIEQGGDGFSVQLQSSPNNRNQSYTTQPDINGKYLIKLERSELSDIEADYVWVYFTLPYYDQLPDKDVYVLGEFTGWQLTKEYLMDYNFQRQAYELRLQLKQGYYNYRFVVKDTKTGEVDHTFFEGNHFETENSYLILVYFKQVGDRYDRLVGTKRINSLNKN